MSVGRPQNTTRTRRPSDCERFKKITDNTDNTICVKTDAWLKFGLRFRVGRFRYRRPPPKEEEDPDKDTLEVLPPEGVCSKAAAKSGEPSVLNPKP